MYEIIIFGAGLAVGYGFRAQLANFQAKASKAAAAAAKAYKD